MNRKKLLTIGIIATLGAAALFGAFAYGSTRLASPVQAAPENRLALQMPDRGVGDGSTQEDLANALGISVDELAAAQQQAYHRGNRPGSRTRLDHPGASRCPQAKG